MTTGSLEVKEMHEEDEKVVSRDGTGAPGATVPVAPGTTVMVPVAPGATVLQQGDPGDCFYVIQVRPSVRPSIPFTTCLSLNFLSASLLAGRARGKGLITKFPDL